MDYVYQSINNHGKKQNGTIAAENMEAALNILKKKKLYVISINESLGLQKNIELSDIKKIKGKDLSFFCRQMATMLKAGINLLQCISLVRSQTTNKKFSRIINKVYEQVEKGSSLSNAMKQYEDIFPEILTNMIEAGEVSGSMDEAFIKMAEYFEKRDKLSNKIKNALLYPIIVLIVALIVLNVMLIFVLPTFSGLFRDMNMEVPPLTKAIINLGNFMSKAWYILLMLIGILIWIYKAYKRTPQGAITLGKRKIKMPLFGMIEINSETSSFARTLSTLFTAGVPLVPALYTTQKLFLNKYIGKEFEKVLEDVKGGESLSVPVESLGIFPNLVPAMIKTGEESGNLESMLNQIAEYYENEVDNSVTRLTTVFEPVMLVFLAVLVGLLLASIIMPMFKLYGGIK